MIWLPTLGQLLRLHEKTVARSGGSVGIRDIGLIESALMRANASFGGADAYATISEKAAAVCCDLHKRGRRTKADKYTLLDSVN